MTTATATHAGSAPARGLQPLSPFRPGPLAVDEAWERRSWDQFPMEKGESSRSRSQALVFGRFRFVVHSRELTADGAPVAIGNRALEVLAVLIDGRGELVTKDELLSRVWPTTIVEENNLQFQISSLRKVLGEDRDAIKTVSGRGYRFVAEIRAESRVASAG